MRNVFVEFINYMEFERGYDPIGSSDVLSDATRWLAGQRATWVFATQPEDWYAKFATSDSYKKYYGGSK